MDVGGFGQWKGRNSSKGKGKNSTGTGKGKGTGKDGKNGAKSSGRVNTPKTQSVLELRENRSPIQGLLGEPWQMATATESRTFKILLEREVMRRANQAKVEERKENPKKLEHLCGMNSRVQ